MRRALLALGLSALLLTVTPPAWASPDQSDTATMTVSVQVVRPCTVRTAEGGSVECGGQTPSTVRMSTSDAPAPQTLQTNASTSQPQFLTILF
jgi:hypothetical protein